MHVRHCQVGLTLHYQPKIRTNTLELDGVEAGVPHARMLHAFGDVALADLGEIQPGAEGPALAALLREIVESGAEIYHFETHEISLEEIYLRTLSAPAQPAEAALC